MFLAILLASLVGNVQEYCSGYRQGFTAGYCAGHQFCTSAPVPSCPSEDASWNDGYNRGWADGETVHAPNHPY